MTLEYLLVSVALLLIASILASKASGRLGVPALVLFILLGALAGSEGPGGIEFDDAALAQSVGVIALIFILFAGGLDTNWLFVRPVLAGSLSLATVGVVLSALAVGSFAHYVMGFTAVEGLLRGSEFFVPDGSTILLEGDRLMTFTSKESVDTVRTILEMVSDHSS